MVFPWGAPIVCPSDLMGSPSDLACAAIPSPSATGRHKQQSPAPEAHTRAHASSPGSPSPYTQPPHTSPKTLEREHMRLCCDYAAPSMLRLCCFLMGCGPVRSDYSACSAVRRNPSGSDQTLRGFLLGAWQSALPRKATACALELPSPRGLPPLLTGQIRMRAGRRLSCI